jgi:hypothetical protein
MTTIIIDEKHKQARSLLAYLKELAFVKVIDEDTSSFNKETKKAIEDAKKGKTNKYDTLSDFIQRVNNV